MAVYSYLSNANDGYVSSNKQDDSGTPAAHTGGTTLSVGQLGISSTAWDVYQGLTEYSHAAVPATELATSASMALQDLAHTPSGDSWSLEVRDFDWGGTITAADWVPAANIPDHTLLCEFPRIRDERPMPKPMLSGGPGLRARVATTSPLRLLWNTSKQRLGLAASGNGDEYIYLGTNEAGTGYYRPKLDYYTTTVSSLTRVRSAAVQLSDGSHVWLDADTAGAVVLKHNPAGTTYSTVASLSIGAGTTQFASPAGADAFSVTRDSADNIYVAGQSGAAANDLLVQAFAKGAGYTWTAKTPRSSSMPSYDTDINQVAAVWHQTSGAGHLAVLVAHEQGATLTGQTALAALSCSALLGGTGTALTAITAIVPSTAGFPINTSGTGLDILARTGGAGVIGGASGGTGGTSSSPTVAVWRYTLSSGGAFSTSPTLSSPAGYFIGAALDGDSTARLAAISATKFALLINSEVYVYSDSAATGLTQNGSRNLAAAGLTAYGAARIRPHDMVYDAGTNKLRVYYTDAANSRRLMRTGYNVSTNLLDLVETQVATNLGASGSSHLAIRMPRGAFDERRLLVSLANKTGGGVHSTVYLADAGLNQAPNAPVLTNPGTFPADQLKTLTWSFSDNNPLDVQSAYQLQIRVQSTGVSAYDSGKVASSSSAKALPGGTLSNSVLYEWQARTYDASDSVSAYSAYQQFQTSSAGVAAITSPAADNLAGLASPDLLVAWSFTVTPPTAQADYRIRVVRTDTSATLMDTGYIAGPAVTSYTIHGLISDVEQRIEVLLRDSGGSISNTATRLVTPSFSAPDAPTITAQANADGSGVAVSVTNPEPTGSLPPASTNDIYRALAGSGEWLKVAQCLANSSATDYGAAAGVSYDYYVEAVADGHTASNVVTDVRIDFLGVYVHRVGDAENTLRHFPYGGAVNKDTTKTPGTELRFTGRTYPVWEFSDQLDEKVDVQVVVPFGPDHTAGVEHMRDVVRSRLTHCYRDSRGRRVFGVVDEVAVADDRAGSTVGLTVVRVDYAEGLD